MLGLRHVTIAAAVFITLLAFGADAQAWTPYTHDYIGDNAYADATDDGMVTINGVEYPIPPEVWAALVANPASYNAGVVGPDAYPDSVTGQKVIHPEETGEWLRHTLNKAWDAQADPNYSAAEKGEILAFAYGYLTHAAGDMWAHTLVNDFAQGVFPSFAEIGSDPARVAIAVRHVIVEGYMADATPGFDGNPNRALVPTEVNEDGAPQVSDSSTPGIAFKAPPDRFLWETFIGRAADSTGRLTLPLPGQPTAYRGPLLEFFFDLRNDLDAAAGANSNWEELLDDFATLQARIDAVLYECSFPPSLDCPGALLALGISSIDNLVPGELIGAAIEEIADAYLRAWVEDIDHGLQNWGSIGQGFAAGLFDPATRRAYQDKVCGESGDEGTAERAACEDGAGTISTFFDALDTSFTTGDPHLLSMLGAPDLLGTVIEGLSQIADTIDALVDFPNPISAAIAELQAYMKEKITEAVSEALDFDVEVFVEILKNPYAYMDPGPLPTPLPAPLNILNESGVFAAGEHARLDAIMGLPDGHHEPNRRLGDDVEFTIPEFDPLENSVVTAKLLLLGGEGMNQVLSNQLGRTVSTYPAGVRTNVMVNGLPGGTEDYWLRSIDSDHAWRQDGAPVFCNEGAACPPGVRANVIRRPAVMNGGNGNFPVWESCVARPAFALLFDDWEQADGQPEFPAYGDGAGPDPGSDPNAPTSLLTVAGKQYTDPTTLKTFLGQDHLFTLTAQDSPADRGFEDDELSLRYRIDGGAGGQWVEASQGEQFSIIGLADGPHTVEVQSGDPCHTLDESDALAAESIQYFEFLLDTTPPVVTCATPPFSTTWDTDDSAIVDFSVSDGAGSGVMSQSALIDKFETPAGSRATFDGDTIDMYRHYPDTVTVTVTAEDFVGNSGDTGCRFELEATPDSLINNLARAKAEGDIPNTGVYNGLSAKLDQVKKHHDKGKHATESNVLGAFINQLQGQRGKGIDRIVAERFIAFAEEAIAEGR